MATARVALSAADHAGAAFSAAARPDPPQKRPSLGASSRRLDLCLIAFGRDGAMGLFLVLFWCSAVTGDILRYNSRFGVFNSRLRRRKFPFPLLRELAGKGLICLTVFAAKTAVIRRKRENSRFHGNNREFCRHRRNGRWHSLQRRRSAFPSRSSRRRLPPECSPLRATQCLAPDQAGHATGIA